MLVVKQVDTEDAAELAYECYDKGQVIGRLRARLGRDGRLEARLFDIVRREAGRTLVAKLEKDAAAHGLSRFALLTRDQAEAADFFSNGYEPSGPDSLRLLKPPEA